MTGHGDSGMTKWQGIDPTDTVARRPGRIGEREGYGEKVWGKIRSHVARGNQVEKFLGGWNVAEDVDDCVTLWIPCVIPSSRIREFADS